MLQSLPAVLFDSRTVEILNILDSKAADRWDWAQTDSGEFLVFVFWGGYNTMTRHRSPRLVDAMAQAAQALLCAA